jgi:uncharacterized protein (TIGR00290 family)
MTSRIRPERASADRVCDRSNPVRAWVSWSSGKDSAFALQRARDELGLDVTALLVSVNTEAERVSMHAVRAELLALQADRLGLPVHRVELPAPCPNDVYETAMLHAMRAARDGGVERVVFGDLFLDDVRRYREGHLAATGIAPEFPLWGEPTDRLAREMLDVGVRAVLTCIDPRVLPASFAGRAFDDDLLADLPDGVDPCGEHGEFHTFVHDAPGFSSPIPIALGETVVRDGFVFCDVLPA